VKGHALPSLQDAHWFDEFGTRARPTAIAEFTGVDDATRESIEARVLADRPRWQTHDERGTSPFYTLGSPTYIRGNSPFDRQAQQYLRDRYRDAHQALLERLGAILEAPVELSPHDSAPGFHIFEAGAGVTHPAVGMHLDAQYRHLDHQDPRGRGVTHSSQLVSVTTVIRADGDAGLDYVPLPHIPGAPMRTEPTRHLGYEPGRLVVQFGLFPHNVAAFGTKGAQQLRITFQAHAIRGASGAWRLYW
jgi:hypothetical protein